MPGITNLVAGTPRRTRAHFTSCWTAVAAIFSVAASSASTHGERTAIVTLHYAMIADFHNGAVRYVRHRRTIGREVGVVRQENWRYRVSVFVYDLDNLSIRIGIDSEGQARVLLRVQLNCLQGFRAYFGGLIAGRPCDIRTIIYAFTDFDLHRCILKVS